MFIKKLKKKIKKKKFTSTFHIVYLVFVILEILRLCIDNFQSLSANFQKTSDFLMISEEIEVEGALSRFQFILRHSLS